MCARKIGIDASAFLFTYMAGVFKKIYKMNHFLIKNMCFGGKNALFL